MKRLLIIALLAGGGALFLRKQPEPPQHSRVTDTPPESQPLPVAEKPPLAGVPVVKREAVVVIRGVVRGEENGVLIVDCGPDPDVNGFSWNVDAGTGAAGIKQLAKQATATRDKKILERFGALKMVSNGVLRSAISVPADRPIGRFAVYGYPEKSEHIHVVAAAVGRDYKGLPLYAASYTFSNPSTNAPRSVFPAGIDTPEERRKYLEELAASRKKGTGQTGN